MGGSISRRRSSRRGQTVKEEPSITICSYTDAPPDISEKSRKQSQKEAKARAKKYRKFTFLTADPSKMQLLQSANVIFDRPPC